MRHLFPLFACALALVTLELRAEALPPGRSFFREYGERQGLVSPSLTTLAEDIHGYLYVGTNGGLYRYDGNRFEKLDLGSDSPNPHVLTVVPHHRGGVWVGSNSGVVFVFGSHRHWPKLDNPSDRPYPDLLVLDGEGKAWVQGRAGLYRQGKGDAFFLDPETRKWRSYLLLAGPGPHVLSGSRTIHTFTGEGRWVTRETTGFDAGAAQVRQVDAQGGIWAFQGRRIHYLPKDATAWRTLPQELPDPILSDARPAVLSSGGLLVMTLRTLVRLEGDRMEVLDRSRGLPEEELLTALEDRQGTLWAGGSGLYRKLGSGQFQVYGEEEGLPDRRTWAILRTRVGRLYVGTASGVATLEAGRFQSVPGLEGIYANKFTEDGQGAVWIQDNGQRLYRIPPGGGRATKVAGMPWTLVHFLPRPDGGADVLTFREGLYDCPDLRQPSRLSKTPLKPKMKPNADLRQLRRDSSGRVVVVSSDGLHVLDRGRWHSFRKDQGLLNDDLHGLRIGPDGVLWITYSNPTGVTRARVTGDRLEVLEHCGLKTSLPTDGVYDVLPRRDGGAWVLTDQGLVNWLPTHFRLYTRQDGIGSNDCNEGAVWLDPDGTLWFGTTRGLVRAAGVGERGVWPSARVSSMATPLGTRIFPYDTGFPELAYRHREVTFGFGTRVLSDDGAVQFQVGLAGHDEGLYLSSNPTVHYSGLREGSYTFMVRARRPGEPWGPTAEVAFRVLPPWYRSWWGWSLWVVLGAGGVWGLFRIRLQALTRQRNLLNQEVLARTREIEDARVALELANEALQAQSITDPLTHLKNRRFLDLSLQADLARASVMRAASEERRSEKGPGDLVFLLVDLDRFKVVNDSHGHRVGDEVLRQTALVLRKAMRESDSLVRWGGEEFLLLARDADRRDGAQIAERVRSMISAHAFEVGLRHPLHVTCSVGFAPYPLDGQEGVLPWERVVDLADQCLYIVKRSGRNGWMGVLDGRITAIHAGNTRELHDAASRGEIELLASMNALQWE